MKQIREYKMYTHPTMGCCAMLKTSFGWQQVSHWYTTPSRIVTYWASRNGLILDWSTHRFREYGHEFEVQA